MAFHYFKDHYKIRVMTESVDTISNEHGKEVAKTFSIEDPGSVFQLVSKELRDYHSLSIEYWLRPLGEYEPKSNSYWYIRRGRRFFPWLIAWELCGLWYRLHKAILLGLYRSLHLMEPYLSDKWMSYRVLFKTIIAHMREKIEDYRRE